MEAKLQQALAREALTEWLPSYEQAKDEQTQLAEELSKLYSMFAPQLVDLLQRIAATDAAAQTVNMSKPPVAQGDGRYLGVTPGGHIASTLQLPSLDATGAMIWPKHRSLAVEALVAVPRA